jgi:hypothetical protein
MNWISMKEELPPRLKETKEYIVSIEFGGPKQSTSAYWMAGTDMWEDGLGDILDGVTHWMPFPSPPEDGNA